jgi:peptidoglycan/xylan/chitin deacetylase (PgdA/CDA1 family)
MKGLCILVCAVLVCSPAAGCGSDSGEAADVESVETLLEKGIKPNEMGMVMILEYHRIAPEEGSYTRSIENFKKDLQTLYDQNYRLVTLHDLMSGKADTPAGTTPVVFSFDDSTEGQFRYLKEGEKTVIDPECALGMMQEFSRQHPDFGYTALFNYLPSMFEQPKYESQKVEYLKENGFELGNHTDSHPSLGSLSDEEVQKEIALPVRNMREIDPEVKVDILCLPHGSVPENEALMYEGSYDGITYSNKWALLVGSNPFYPPYHYRNPERLLPRIQVMDYDPEDGSGTEGSEYWLRYFERNPELRYVSDGNPNTVCAPAYMRNRLSEGGLPSGVQFVGY